MTTDWNGYLGDEWESGMDAVNFHSICVATLEGTAGGSFPLIEAQESIESL